MIVIAEYEDHHAPSAANGGAIQPECIADAARLNRDRSTGAAERLRVRATICLCEYRSKCNCLGGWLSGREYGRNTMEKGDTSSVGVSPFLSEVENLHGHAAYSVEDSRVSVRATVPTTKARLKNGLFLL